jgi:hypothetical protein
MHPLARVAIPRSARHCSPIDGALTPQAGRIWQRPRRPCRQMSEKRNQLYLKGLLQGESFLYGGGAGAVQVTRIVPPSPVTVPAPLVI